MPRTLLQSDPPTLPMALSWPAQESVYEPDNKTFKLTKPTHASTSSPSRSSHSSDGFFVACTRSLTTIICRYQPMPRQLLQRDHRDPTHPTALLWPAQECTTTPLPTRTHIHTSTSSPPGSSQACTAVYELKVNSFTALHPNSCLGFILFIPPIAWIPSLQIHESSKGQLQM